MSKRALAALLAAVLILGSETGAARAQAGIDRNELLARIVRARQIAEQGMAAPKNHLMVEIRETLGLPVSLALLDRTVVIEKDEFLESLDGDTANEFRAARSHLAFLESQVRSLETVSSPNRGEIADSLREAYRGISVSESPMDRLRLLVNRAIAAALEFLFRVLFSDDASFAVLRYVALALLVVGLLLLARYIVRRLKMVPARTLQMASEGGVRVVDWQRVFEEALARGDLREAVRARYRILLGTLAASGVIGDDPSLTAGECRQAVRSKRPKLFPSVVEATLTFERVAYGDAAAENADIERIHRAEVLAKAS